MSIDQDKSNLSSAPWIIADNEENVEDINENVSIKKKVFVFVNPSTPRKDSYVTTSFVPSLKLLCRGRIICGTSLPPIGVKEGLEYYHALVWPDNCMDDRVFKYISYEANLSMVPNITEYEELCKEPLKVAIYLEKKISKSRDKFGYRHSHTKQWVEKYQSFLKFPLHDVYLVVNQSGYRVLEFPLDDGNVGLMCIVCPMMKCGGCINKNPKKTFSWEPGKKQVTLRTVSKHNAKDASKGKKARLKVIKDSSLKKKNDIHPSGEVRKLPPFQLHYCSPCKTAFNNKLALSSHRLVCQAIMKCD